MRQTIRRAVLPYNSIIRGRCRVDKVCEVCYEPLIDHVTLAFDLVSNEIQNGALRAEPRILLQRTTDTKTMIHFRRETECCEWSLPKRYEEVGSKSRQNKPSLKVEVTCAIVGISVSSSWKERFADCNEDRIITWILDRC